MVQTPTVAPFPFIVWGADEIRRWLIRRYRADHTVAAPSNPPGE
jgi:hypothetical protein